MFSETEQPDQPACDHQVRDVWDRYRSTGAREDRDRLVLHYMSLVCSMAGKIGSRLPRSVEVDDLMSAGAIGLINAVESFDPGRGIAFAAFAWFRIRGAMLDELRSQDWLPRGARARARRAVVGEPAGAPTPVHGADEGSLPKASSGPERLRSGAEPEILSIGGLELVERNLRDPRQETALDALIRQDLGEWLMRQLRPADRQVLTMYYVQRLRLRQIAAALGVSASRVSQRISELTVRLRTRARRLAA